MVRIGQDWFGCVDTGFPQYTATICVEGPPAGGAGVLVGGRVATAGTRPAKHSSIMAGLRVVWGPLIHFCRSADFRARPADTNMLSEGA